MSAPPDLRATVLITNYNYGRFLGYAVESALEQTWPNVQVIVVDDGSTDESRLLLQTYGETECRSCTRGYTGGLIFFMVMQASGRLIPANRSGVAWWKCQKM